MECSLKQGEWSEGGGKLNRVLLEINIWSADRDKLNRVQIEAKYRICS